MSKNTNTVKKPLSNGAKKAIWITAICLAAVIALTVSLGYILNNDTINPDSDGSNSSGSSSLKIPNGDFLFTKSESTNVPYEAQNWAKKTYSSETTFGTIENEQKVVMGVVNTTDSVWDDIVATLNEKTGKTITNPHTHEEGEGIIDKEAVKEDDVDIRNVYMIATKEATNASILSDSFTIASSASVRITVWLNTAQLTSGKASVMVQQLSTPNSANRYAYDLEIEHTTTDGGNGWQKNEFYVFNRSSASKSIRINVGLGDVYNNENAEGVLFIDDIQYETVTANEYRENYIASTGTDTKVHKSYVIKPTDNEDVDATFVAWTGSTDIGGVEAYLNESAAKDSNGKAYSPFVKGTTEDPIDTFAIYRADNTGSFTKTIDLKNAKDELDDYLHIYFWMRVANGTTYKQASIVDVTVRDASETDDTKNLAKLTNIGDVDDFTTDVNCGWKQYHIYVKPDQDILDGAKVTVSIDWAKTGLTHDGTIYASDLMYEFIADTTYTGASTSTTTVKADFNKTHATTGVTNGTFGYLEDTNKKLPESWTPVYAGANSIYNDGKGDDVVNGLNISSNAIANEIFKGTTANPAPLYDDEYGYYLNVVNKVATAQGYLSQSISLSAKSVYRISVLAKATSAQPYIYLINQAAAQGENGSREKAIIGKFEGAAANSTMDDLLMQPAQENGWVRYYFIVETADEAVSVNVALFNGSIDGRELKDGTVSYDQVCTELLGNYTVAKDTDNEDAKLYKVAYTEKSNSGYADLFDTYFADVDGNTETMNTIEFKDGDVALGNVKVVRLADDDKWAEMREIPEETEKDEVADDEDTTTETKNDVDVGLLLSVISSILLVACLLVVVVVKAFKKKRA